MNEHNLTLRQVKDFVLKINYLKKLSNCNELEDYLIHIFLVNIQNKNTLELNSLLEFLNELYDFIVKHNLYTIEYINNLKIKCSLFIKTLNYFLKTH